MGLWILSRTTASVLIPVTVEHFPKGLFFQCCFDSFAPETFSLLGKVSAPCRVLFLSTEPSYDAGRPPFLQARGMWSSGPRRHLSRVTQDCGSDHMNSGSDPWNLLLVLLLLLSLLCSASRGQIQQSLVASRDTSVPFLSSPRPQLTLLLAQCLCVYVLLVESDNRWSRSHHLATHEIQWPRS